MKDIFGFELFVGDTIAFVDSADNSLTMGTIDHIYPDNPDIISIKYNENNPPYGGFTNKYAASVAKRVLKPADLKLLKFTIGSNS